MTTRKDMIERAVEALRQMQIAQYSVDIPEMDKEEAATTVVDLVLRELHARPSQELEADELVYLRARIHRVDSEQALIEFLSMGGPFSVRVPVSALTPVLMAECRHPALRALRSSGEAGGWLLCPDCGASVDG